MYVDKKNRKIKNAMLFSVDFGVVHVIMNNYGELLKITPKKKRWFNLHSIVSFIYGEKIDFMP